MGGMDPLGKSQSSSVAKAVFLVNARKPTWGVPRVGPGSNLSTTFGNGS